MDTTLCITIRFIQPYPLFHGRCDAEEPEWPPSPMRAYQALLNAAGLRARGRSLEHTVRSALQLLETLRPDVIAPRAAPSTVGYRAYVPHNQADLVTAAWHRGSLDASVASHRIEKDIRPMRMESWGDDLPTIHYLYPLRGTNVDPHELLAAVRPAVRSIYCLGWGIDQVVADAVVIDRNTFTQDAGERWRPASSGGRHLRVPVLGTLDALVSRHDRFLTRLLDSNWTHVPPVSASIKARYRRDDDPATCPSAVFKLIDENDDTVTYPQSKLVHIAGMVRHVAIEAMKRNPPRPSDLRGRSLADWVESYVAGHRSEQVKQSDVPHSQFSYIPLQSIGVTHTDPGVRRVMIVAPVGDDAWLEHLAVQLNGMLLKPLPNTTLPPGTRLERIDDHRKDGVRDAYLGPSNTWSTVTPVILPGHDDHKPEKTRSLIIKALQQSGIEQPCEFDWSAFSDFRKMLPAHKYRKDPNDPSKRVQINYVRPDYLLDKTAVHLRLTFAKGLEIPGPIAIGAGRHRGLGLFAATQ